LDSRNSIIDSGLIFFFAVLWVSLLRLLLKVRGIRMGCGVWKEEECNNVMLKKYNRDDGYKDMEGRGEGRRTEAGLHNFWAPGRQHNNFFVRLPLVQWGMLERT
jgi:hypothetical protein